MSEPAGSNIAASNFFANLAQPDDRVMVTYVWIDGSQKTLRAKTKTLNKEPLSPADCPVWNFDGSSTGQAEGHKSDVFIHARAMFRDPFMGGKNKLVMCDTFDREGRPHESNKRFNCAKVMNEPIVKESKPWFGIEQEYIITTLDGRVLGWPTDRIYPAPQGPYYCGVGADKVAGRDVSDAHYRACLYAGVKVAGTNAEVMLGQWEYQVGPCEGIEMGDQLWMSRYLLERVAERFNVTITLHPKPVLGDWNGSGAHTNYSTVAMRENGGLEHIKQAINKLEKRHNTHIKVYDPSGGENNAMRLSGLHETCHISQFKAGEGDRGGSVRIPLQVAIDGKGYLEDRRPSSDCDPYSVTEIIVRTTVLNESD